MINATKMFITETDFSRLSSLLESTKTFLGRDREHLSALEQQLRDAEIVDAQDLPNDVVTINSSVKVCDLDTGEEAVYTISFPRDVHITKDRVSVLAPIGTFLIGRPVGATVDVQVPRGKKRLRVLQVVPSAGRTNA